MSLRSIQLRQGVSSRLHACAQLAEWMHQCHFKAEGRQLPVHTTPEVWRAHGAARPHRTAHMTHAKKGF